MGCDDNVSTLEIYIKTRKTKKFTQSPRLVYIKNPIPDSDFHNWVLNCKKLQTSTAHRDCGTRESGSRVQADS